MLISKPKKEDLMASYNKSVPDVIKSDLNVLFCGINPGLYTAAIQKHFGRPGNKFWKALHLSGFTPRLYDPSEQHELLNLGLGITNLVNRATPSQKGVSKEEFVVGGRKLKLKLNKFKPKWVAFIGIDAYRKAYKKPKAGIGEQKEKIGITKIWLLPSTSGLNAHYTLDKISDLFRELKSNSGPIVLQK